MRSEHLLNNSLCVFVQSWPRENLEGGGMFGGIRVQRFIFTEAKTKPNLYHFCTTYDSCDLIKMRKMRGEVGKETPKMENPSFL